MKHYKIERSESLVDGRKVTLLKVAFGEPASNDVIVKEVAAEAEGIVGDGGPLCLIDGPASLPVGFVLAHAVLHRFAAVAVFDPKIPGFLVVSSHGSPLAVGDVIPK